MASSTHSQVQCWLRDSLGPHAQSPLESPASISRKRKRSSQATYEMRSGSPSKRPRNYDDSSLSQSGSRTDTIALSERTKLTATGSGTGSAKRTSSPSRHLADLRTAQPPITLSVITAPPQQPPEDIMRRLGQLRRRFVDAIKGGYIPGGLKGALEQDEAFQLALVMEPIDEEAFDYTDERTLADFGLVDTLQRVKKIFQNAILCTQYGRDENAWCFSVVWPLLELSIESCGKDRWQPESVQSQNISPLYLSRLSNDRPLFRKTDFCFSYSYFNPRFKAIYKRLEDMSASNVSHTTDDFTSRAFLFSGIEVKRENGDQKEAELQLSIWMAANLRKKMELASQSEREHAADQNKALLEPAVAIIGHDHKIYYAYPSSSAGDIAILGPDDLSLSTRSVQGIFRLIRFYATMLDYGYQLDGIWGDYIAASMK